MRDQAINTRFKSVAYQYRSIFVPILSSGGVQNPGAPIEHQKVLCRRPPSQFTNNDVYRDTFCYPIVLLEQISDFKAESFTVNFIMKNLSRCEVWLFRCVAKIFWNPGAR